MKSIILKKEHYENILVHCISMLPYEAVGIVAGNKFEEIVATFPLVNELKEVNSFFVNPYSQFKTLKLIRELQLIPLALYHSHPEGLPILSESDIYFAKKHDLIQIVISLNMTEPISNRAKAYKVNHFEGAKEIDLIIK